MLETILSKEIIAPAIIIAVSALIYFILTRIINRVYNLKLTRKNDKKRQTIHGLINNIIKYFIIIVDLTMILEIYGIDTKSLIASLGVLSLVAGLALQDVLKDFIVGISILFEDQYSVGDTVEISGFKGTIVQFGLRTTRIRAYTGETKIIANRNITELVNYNLNENIALIDVMISYESDLNKAKKVLTEICDKINKDSNKKSKAECLGVDDLADNGIIIKVAIPANYEEKASLTRNFKEQVKIEFDKQGIDIPYPQVVIHDGKRL